MSKLTRYNAYWPAVFSDALMEDFLAPRRHHRGNGHRAFLTAPADVIEGEKQYTIRIDLPGVKKDDIDLSVKNGILTITGQRKTEEKQDTERCHCSERRTGSFQRSFRLDDGIDSEGIEASLSDGVLEVTLPKKPEVLPKQIQVN